MAALLLSHGAHTTPSRHGAQASRLALAQNRSGIRLVSFTMWYKEEYLEVVCGVVFDLEGRVLVCKRPQGKSLAGLWEFPGGKVEVGERDEEALRRELLEELGCEVHVGAALTVVEHDYGDFRIRLRPFRCLLERGAVRALEHDEVRWVGLGELGEIDFAAADLPILLEL